MAHGLIHRRALVGKPAEGVAAQDKTADFQVLDLGELHSFALLENNLGDISRFFQC
jgi:hypothetical protein